MPIDGENDGGGGDADVDACGPRLTGVEGGSSVTNGRRREGVTERALGALSGVRPSLRRVVTGVGGRRSTSVNRPVRVLNVVTNEKAEFFKQQVKSLAARGVEVDTLTVPGENRIGGTRSPFSYLDLFPYVFRRSFGEYDVLHANYGLTGPVALAQPNLPVVLSLWGSDLYGTFGPVSRVCARLSDAVIVMSGRMKEDLGVDCAVIPHGVDLGRFAPESKKSARQAVGWDPDERHVLFPYSPENDIKDYPRAERVVDRVDARHPEAVSLQWIKNVPHEQVPTYMNAADCLLLTSKREGSPNTVKEALACSVPVVSTDVGNVQDLLRGVEPSAVRRTDDGLVEALTGVLEHGGRSNGRERARELSLERMAERIEGVYRRVLE
jgi:glycosyltransferase involved in cell wall biosynthesis